MRAEEGGRESSGSRGLLSRFFHDKKKEKKPSEKEKKTQLLEAPRTNDAPREAVEGRDSSVADFYYQASVLDEWPVVSKSNPWEEEISEEQSFNGGLIFHKVRRAQFIQYRKVDALSYLRKGCSFLIFGRSGPLFRNVQLSNDGSTITAAAAGSDPPIVADLRSGCTLFLGQTTPGFAKAPRLLALMSFSVVTPTTTLEFVAKDALEFCVWTEGLSILIEDWNCAPATVPLHKDILVKIPLLREGPSSYLSCIRRGCGSLRKLGFFMDKTLQTSVPLPLSPGESVFVSKRAKRKLKRIDCTGFLAEGSNFITYLKGDTAPRLRRVAVKDGRLTVHNLERKTKHCVDYDVMEISRVRLGQTTKRFNRLQAPRELALLSFTIVLTPKDSKPRTVDLIAQTLDSFELWHSAMLEVARNPRAFCRTESPNRAVVEVCGPCREGSSNRFALAFKIEPKLQERCFVIESPNEGVEKHMEGMVSPRLSRNRASHSSSSSSSSSSFSNRRVSPIRLRGGVIPVSQIQPGQVPGQDQGSGQLMQPQGQGFRTSEGGNGSPSLPSGQISSQGVQTQNVVPRGSAQGPLGPTAGSRSSSTRFSLSILTLRLMKRTPAPTDQDDDWLDNNHSHREDDDYLRSRDSESSISSPVSLSRVAISSNGEGLSPAEATRQVELNSVPDSPMGRKIPILVASVSLGPLRLGLDVPLEEEELSESEDEHDVDEKGKKKEHYVEYLL